MTDAVGFFRSAGRGVGIGVGLCMDRARLLGSPATVCAWAYLWAADVCVRLAGAGGYAVRCGCFFWC